MKVYVFGDSHAGKFGVDPERFVLGNAGQATAHNLCNTESQSESWFNLQQFLHTFDPAEDVFMFALGEIDCRIHLYRQSVLTLRHVNDLIADTVERYGRIIKAVRDDGRRVAVLDVVPAVAQPNIYLLDHYGTRDQRAEVTRRFNAALGRWCEANDIPFIRLYPYIADDRGWLKEEYALDDEAHASESCVPFVVDELAKHFPI